MRQNMKTLRTVLSLLIVCLLISNLSLSAKGKSKESVLLEKLNRAKGASRLSCLEDLSCLYWDVPQEEYWLRRLYKESLQYDSLNMAETTLANLARYYHNNSMSAPLVECSKRADILAHRRKIYSPSFFTVKNFECQRYLWDGHYEDALDHTMQVLNLAVESKSHYGQETCEELLGLIYQMMGRNERALSHLEIAYDLLLKYQHQNFTAIAQLTTTLIEVQLALNHLDEAYRYIVSFGDIQKDVQKGIYGKQTYFPISRNNRLMYIYYAEYYYRRNQMKLMEVSLERAQKYKDSDVYVDFLMNYAKAKYAKTNGNYEMALSYINKVIEADGGSTIEYIKFRADIYMKMGRENDAVEEYQKCLKMQQDSSNVSFDRQLAKLQHVYDVKQMDLQLKNNELRIRKMQIKELVGIAFFFLLVAVILATFLLKMKRLQAVLKSNNVKLADSEKSLKTALAKANEVENLKRSFLHNVNHEIRTPLNAIVGFSHILAEDEVNSLEERSEYSHIIETNSDLLLGLLNKMIDISKYESSSLLSAGQNERGLCNLQNLCLSCLDTLSTGSKVHQGVELKFEGFPENFVLYSQRAILEKILQNLLENAAKNTEQGSITLSYDVDQTNAYVRFAVTDTGKGIDKKLRECLFKGFSKGDDYVPGLGLGLSLCSILVKSFGGKIFLDEDYRTGCRFVFTHPISPDSKADALS